VALQLHGCGGLQPFQAHYARAAMEAGVAAVVVDSFAPRGIGRREASLTVCTGARLRGAQRAADLFALLGWLRVQPWADPARVAAIGWSHGGWAIMDALALGEGAARVTGLADADPLALNALRATILVYPYAAFPSLTAARGWGEASPSVHCILGGRDAVAGVRFPTLALERLKRDGLAVDTLVFDDATHAFDDDAANDPRSRYRPDLAGQARDYYVAALRGALLQIPRA
jgi:dienelactone hydrolase